MRSRRRSTPCRPRTASRRRSWFGARWRPTSSSASSGACAVRPCASWRSGAFASPTRTSSAWYREDRVRHQRARCRGDRERRLPGPGRILYRAPHPRHLRFILGELREKLGRKFRLTPDVVDGVMASFEARMQVVRPSPLDPPACRDPDDDWVLATAVVGRCDCVITGDADLLDLQEYAGIRLLRPRAFLDLESPPEP